MSDNHGNTPAAWTAVVVALAGFVVGGLGLMVSPINMTVFWIGMILLPVSLVVFAVMTKMGLGSH